MSSATNEKRGHLEDEFQRRMHDAEASPSPDLWARIDHDLTIQESKHYKGRMVLYRQLAAACFVLFMLAGALLTYNYNSKQSIDAGIAAMQLKTEPGGATEDIATVEDAPANAFNSVSGLPKQGQNSATAIPEKTNEHVVEKAAHASESINQTAIAGANNSVSKSINAGAVTNYTSSPGVGANAGADYSINRVAASEPTAAAVSLSSFSKSDGASLGTSSSSLFEMGRPYFQTARQAITSVPAAYLNSADQGRARSLVELSKTAVSDYLDKQTKAEEVVAITLNTTPSESKNEEEAAKDNRWSVGVGYAPSYFNQNIQMPGQMMGTVSRFSLLAGGPNKTDQTSDNMNEARDEFEANTDPAFSYAAEVKAGFKLFKKIKLLAGVGFTQNTARTKSSYIINQFVYKPGTEERVAMPGTTVFLPSLNNNFTTDSLSVNKTDDFTVNYRYRHITLPVGLQYDGNIGKDWFWYAAGGVAANFLIETTVMASTNEVKDVSYGHNDDSPFRKMQFSGNVSAGFGKRISNLVSVTAGPEFRGYLNSLLAEPDKALAPQGNPYTIGINMSVNYNLGMNK
ncbi:PorT family protein [Pontibacter sp. H249]|uniref:PorT family protein n=1 Tax=Pontibacter sp. H249 TaxID=3133420 RepID=UPI0030BE29DE